MSRIVVTLSVVLVSAAATATFTACDVGSVVQSSTGADGNTAGGDTGGSAGSDCENISATPPDGHHVDGAQTTALQGCMNGAGCHNAALGLGLNAPEYSYGGTLFKDVAGTMPYAGATILITLNGVTKKVITANNGNFWLTPGVAGLAAPTNAMQGDTKATGCPTTLSMVGKLVQGGGNCNNCHRTGGTTTPMYLTP